MRKNHSRLWRSLALIVSLVTIVPKPIEAASGDVNFLANLSEPALCIIQVQGAGGTLGNSADGKVLSSKLAGGAPGTARVFSFFRYDLQADVVPFWTSGPIGGNTGVTFSSTFSSTPLNSRGANFTDRPGTNPFRLNLFSDQQISVDMTATRPTVFPAGDYEGLVILRCE